MVQSVNGWPLLDFTLWKRWEVFLFHSLLPLHWQKNLKAGSPLELSFWLFPTFLYHVKEELQTNLLMKAAWKNSNGKLTKLSFKFDVFSIFVSGNRCARWAAAQRAVIRIDQGKSRWVAVGMLKCTVIGRPTCSLTVPGCFRVVPFTQRALTLGSTCELK